MIEAKSNCLYRREGKEKKFNTDRWWKRGSQDPNVLVN